jgi:biopolymer transport protein ExbB/TolQ
VRLVPTLGLALLLASTAGVAAATPSLSLTGVFFDADETMKAVMIVLVLSAVAAIVVTVLKLASGRRLSGGSAFVSALRLGGPLIGLLGAVFVLLMGFIGIANYGQPVPMPVLAPGFAEAALIFFLGLVAGVVGVVCHWAIEARIDRTVLSS